MLPLLLLAALCGSASAQNVTQTSSFSFSPTPVTTSVPMPTSPLNATVPGQGMLPPMQAWCNGGMNDTFCPGVLLQDVQLSGIFADSKVGRAPETTLT
jgi:alpha,alpha-trehalase